MDKLFPRVLPWATLWLVVACATPSPPKSIPSEPPPAVAPPAEPPAWYLDQSLEPAPGRVLGYGDAPERSPARAKALASISETIESQVESDYRLRESVKKADASLVLDVESEIRSAIRLRSRAVLRDTTLRKNEFVGGQYYVAYAFDNRPLIDRLAEVLPPLSAERTSPALYPLAERLRRRGREPVLRLRHADGEWTILAGGKRFTPEPADWREGFFAEHNSTKLDLRLRPGPSVRHEAYYHLETRTRARGYVTLFSVFSDGRALRLGEANRPTEANMTFTFPDLERYDGLIAENQRDRGHTRDLLIAALCSEPRSEFASVVEVSAASAQGDDPLLFAYDKVLTGLVGCERDARFLYIAPRR